MFDVTFSYHTIPDDEFTQGVFDDTHVLALGYSLDAVSIVVRDYERDGSLEVDLFYADDVFDENYRFTDALRHVLTLIERVHQDQDTADPVSRISLRPIAAPGRLNVP